MQVSELHPLLLLLLPWLECENNDSRSLEMRHCASETVDGEQGLIVSDGLGSDAR